MRRLTKQENFWKGTFGDEYILRNNGADIVAANTALFAKVLSRTAFNIESVLELGCNIGMNLIALHNLLPSAELVGVEINKSACEQASNLPYATVYNNSFYDFAPSTKYDVVMAKTVLIHQPPELLPQMYDLMYKVSNKYILIAEYYNPTPVEVQYRGNNDVLFKRDFAGEILDRFADLELVDYGFAYHREDLFPQDDLNWFLLKK